MAVTRQEKKVSKRLVKEVKDTNKAVKEAKQLNALDVKETKAALKEKSLSSKEKKELKKDLKQDLQTGKELKTLEKVTKQVKSDMAKDVGFMGPGAISSVNMQRAHSALNRANKTLSKVNAKSGSQYLNKKNKQEKQTKHLKQTNPTKQITESLQTEKPEPTESVTKQISKANRLVNLVAPSIGKNNEMSM